MKLALVTEDPLTTSHGTGNLLLRLLEGAPLSVTGFSRGTAAGITAFPCVVAQRQRTLSGAMDAVRRRLPGSLRPRGSSETHSPSWRYSLDGAGARALHEADLILVVAYSADGLHFAHDLVASVPGRPPVVLWFMDLLTSRAELGDTRHTLPHFDRARIWAFNGRIRTSLAQLFPQRRDAIELHMFLGVPLPARPMRAARELSADTRCVMIGNVWDPSVLPVLADIWNRASAILGLDLDLFWYGPSAALARVQERGMVLDRRIHYAGHAADLNGVLRDADAAIVAFAAPGESSPFSRHSFPSRVADFAANALPLFAICSPDTALADYLAESGAGLSDPADSVEQAAEACARLLRDVTLRARCASQARQYAEAHFDLDHQRSLLVAELQSDRPAFFA